MASNRKFSNGDGGGRNGRSGRVGLRRAGPGRVATDTEILNERPFQRAEEKYAVRGNPSFRRCCQFVQQGTLQEGILQEGNPQSASFLFGNFWTTN